ncbi:hypothetical protein Tco_0838257 [Tanacetum coccineum]|uniref:Uncharacterized protein n=1 Tax=Tanacetum coccineum TaxID=301880 RepID=A0ABQ5AMB4_9ASTR
MIQDQGYLGLIDQREGMLFVKLLRKQHAAGIVKLYDTLGAATLTSCIDTLKAIVEKIAKMTNDIYSNKTFRRKEEKKELMHSEKEEDQ